MPFDGLCHAEGNPQVFGAGQLRTGRGAAKSYRDDGFLILPESYSESGRPTRLVINCHGAGGTVTTDDSQVEHQALTQYLVANGYAVMDVNGLPAEYAAEKGIDLRNNIGGPMAIESYARGYRYCMERFNLEPEVFVHGGSMGGIDTIFRQTIPAYCVECCH